MLVAKAITNDVILGRDFLQANQCQVRLDCKCNQLHFTTEKTTVNLGHKPRGTAIASVGLSVGESIEVPLQSKMEIMVKTPPMTTSTTSTWLIEPENGERNAVSVAQAVEDSKAGEVPARILNPKNERVTVQKGSQIAVREPLLEDGVQLALVSSIEQIPSTDISMEKQEQLWQIVLDAGDALSAEEQRQLYTVLLETDDLFAEQLDDCRCAEKIKHSINTGNAAPVRQPVRRIPPVRRKEVRKLLSDMLKKDVIQPSSSPWASPIMWVPKKDGSLHHFGEQKMSNQMKERSYWKSLTAAYSDVRNQLQTAHKRQRNQKIRGNLYQKGDLVWLHPWTGPFKLVERIGEADYREHQPVVTYSVKTNSGRIPMKEGVV